jgi:hypothetical protein
MTMVYSPFEAVSYASFVPEVILATADCPEEVAQNYIREAVIDFAERSQVLTRQVSVDVQAGVSDYLLTLPLPERVISVQSMNGEPWSERAVYTTTMGYRLPVQHCGEGNFVQFLPPNVVRLLPTPQHDRPDALHLSLAVAPMRDSCEVDRSFYERYHEAIISGALARLYRAKGTTWFDAGMAKLHQLDFDNRVTAAGLDRLTGSMRGRFRMRPRRVV